MAIEKLIIKNDPKPFTTHLNSVLQHVHDACALGVWCYLSSLPPNWEVHRSQLRKHFNMGRDKMDKVLSFLKENKLISMECIKNDKGQFQYWIIIVHNGTQFNVQNQNTDFQYTGQEEGHVQNQTTEKPEPGKTAPIKERHIKKQINKSIRASDDAQEKSFNEFWKIYPKKRNKKRSNSLWRKIKPELIPIILEDIKKRLLLDNSWKNKQYIPDPSTYLNGERWNDEIITHENEKNTYQKLVLNQNLNQTHSTVPFYKPEEEMKKANLTEFGAKSIKSICQSLKPRFDSARTA